MPTLDTCSATTNQVKTGIKTKGRPFSGTVNYINYEKGVMVMKGKAAQTFYINSSTNVKLDGAPAKPEDIKAGHTIGGYAREGSDGKWVATTINIYTEKSREKSTNPQREPTK